MSYLYESNDNKNELKELKKPWWDNIRAKFIS